MPRPQGGVALMFFPRRMTSPEEGLSKPAMRRSVVVFPHPDGPKRTRHSCCRTDRLSSFKTGRPPGNALVSRSSRKKSTWPITMVHCRKREVRHKGHHTYLIERRFARGEQAVESIRRLCTIGTLNRSPEEYEVMGFLFAECRCARNA